MPLSNILHLGVKELRSLAACRTRGFPVNCGGRSGARTPVRDRLWGPDHAARRTCQAPMGAIRGRLPVGFRTRKGLPSLLGRAKGKQPLHVPRHGHEAPLAARLIQSAQ